MFYQFTSPFLCLHMWPVCMSMTTKAIFNQTFAQHSRVDLSNCIVEQPSKFVLRCTERWQTRKKQIKSRLSARVYSAQWSVQDLFTRWLSASFTLRRLLFEEVLLFCGFCSLFTWFLELMFQFSYLSRSPIDVCVSQQPTLSSISISVVVMERLMSRLAHEQQPLLD